MKIIPFKISQEFWTSLVLGLLHKYFLHWKITKFWLGNKNSLRWKTLRRNFRHLAKISHFPTRKTWWKKHKLYLRQVFRKNCFRKPHSKIFAYRKVFVTRKNFLASPRQNFARYPIIKGCLGEFWPKISDEHVLFEVEDLTPDVRFHQFCHFSLAVLKTALC